MNKIVLQLWEESNRTNGVLSDGCSLHIDENERNNFIDSIYSNREEEVPDSYSRAVGCSIDVFITDSLFSTIQNKKSIKLSQVEFQNLLVFEDIFYNIATI
jgi:hypothetical protein